MFFTPFFDNTAEGECIAMNPLTYEEREKRYTAENREDSCPKDGNELVRTAKEFIEAHFNDKFALEKIAQTLFVNGSYLERVFKKETGHTLLWQHNFVRCEKAKQLLRDSSLSIAWVARQTGDVSPSHFSHIFRRFTGCTPSEYRRKVLEKTLAE